MSTTFDVFPGNNFIPTFNEVIELTNTKIKEFLNSLGIFEEIKLTAHLRKKDESIILDSILEKTVKWDEDYYAWFYIEDIPGGTDGYFWCFDDFNTEIWKEEMNTNPKVSMYSDKINKSLDIGYHWNFRRSAGQPGILCLAYGLISASLCKLTDGVIYSDDGAWDYSLFPSTAEEFLSWYFKPELSTNQQDKEWAGTCIDSIYNELKRHEM